MVLCFSRQACDDDFILKWHTTRVSHIIMCTQKKNFEFLMQCPQKINFLKLIT